MNGSPASSPARRARFGCAAAAVAWLAGIAFTSVAAGLHSGDWVGILVLWALGKPLVLASWAAPETMFPGHLFAARIGCLALALVTTVLMGGLVLWGLAAGGIIAGI